jgi:hypothetical protein
MDAKSIEIYFSVLVTSISWRLAGDIPVIALHLGDAERHVGKGACIERGSEVVDYLGGSTRAYLSEQRSRERRNPALVVALQRKPVVAL